MQTPEEYVSHLHVGRDEKRKRLDAIKDMKVILLKNGHTWPDEADYDEYRQNSTSNEQGTKQNISRIKKYFEAQAQSTSTQSETPSSVATSEPRKTGRKRLDTENGEVRSEKLMLYITPSLIADLRDWCSLKRISCVSYINALIQHDLADKQEKLKSFREFSEDA